MKTCPVCQKTFKTKNGLKQHMSAAHSSVQAQPKRASNRASGSAPSINSRQRMNMTQVAYNDATCRVNRIEWLVDVKSANTSSAHGATSIEVDGVNLPVLSSLGKLFDRYIVHSIQVIYRGSVSTIVDGTVYVAFDYDGKATDCDSVSFVLKYPGNSCPVYTREMVFPLKFDQSTRYVRGTDLRDQLGKVLYYCTTTNKKDAIIGTIFVRYDITLMSLTGG